MLSGSAPAHELMHPLRIFGFVCTFLTVSRIVVSFTEAYSTVRSERTADAELLKLCESGQAAESARFRNACLQARADMASPILFKAALRAFKISYLEFVEGASSWSSMASIVLFLCSGLALPISRFVAMLCMGVTARHASMQHELGDDDQVDEDGMRTISIVHPSPPVRGWRRLRRRFARRGGIKATPYIEDVEEDGFGVTGMTLSRQ